MRAAEGPEGEGGGAWSVERGGVGAWGRGSVERWSVRELKEVLSLQMRENRHAPTLRRSTLPGLHAPFHARFAQSAAGTSSLLILAALSNRVYDFKKVKLMSPVGP